MDKTKARRLFEAAYKKYERKNIPQPKNWQRLDEKTFLEGIDKGRDNYID